MVNPFFPFCINVRKVPYSYTSFGSSITERIPNTLDEPLHFSSYLHPIVRKNWIKQVMRKFIIENL